MVKVPTTALVEVGVGDVSVSDGSATVSVAPGGSGLPLDIKVHAIDEAESVHVKYVPAEVPAPKDQPEGAVNVNAVIAY